MMSFPFIYTITSHNQSFFFLLLRDDLSNLGKLHKLVNRLECHSCIILQLLVIDHLIHVV